MAPLERALWILDYFPRPHDMTTGVWALESLRALERRGLRTVVLAPTPWIPRVLAWSRWLADWAAVPDEHVIDGIPIFYPKCPHYPHRYVTRLLYDRLPVLDGSLVARWCAPTAAALHARHPFQVIHANFVFPAGVVGLALKRRFGVPLVVHERSQMRLRAAGAHPWRRRMYARVMRAADLVITANTRMAREIAAIAGGATSIRVLRDGGDSVARPPAEVRLLPSAGNSSHRELHVEARPERLRGARVLLSVGSFIERKGHAELVRALAQVARDRPDLRCILIGRGPTLGRVRRLAAALGVADRVEFWGQRPHAEVLRAMSWCDVFALPSWDEPCGTVYGEAMTFGKPVIACATEGIAELITHGVHGLLVPPRDDAALAGALRRLVEDERLAAELGRRAQRLAETALSYDTIAGHTIELYERALAQASRA